MYVNTVGKIHVVGLHWFAAPLNIFNSKNLCAVNQYLHDVHTQKALNHC